MKKARFIELLLCGILATACSGPADTEKKEESNEKPADSQLDKADVSYALGYNIGEVLTQTDTTLSLKDLTQGIEDAFTKTDSPRLNQEEVKEVLTSYNLEMSKAMNEKREALLAENHQKGKQYQDQFEKQSGVKRLSGGLLYRVIKEGNGPIPKADDQVVVEYTGKKIDGEVFFSTATQGQPANFTVANVIQGWQAALQEMPQGSKWEIVVPPELAYGDRGVGEIIGPGQTLVFEMELLEVKDKESSSEE